MGNIVDKCCTAFQSEEPQAVNHSLIVIPKKPKKNKLNKDKNSKPNKVPNKKNKNPQFFDASDFPTTTRGNSTNSGPPNSNGCNTEFCKSQYPPTKIQDKHKPN